MCRSLLRWLTPLLVALCWLPHVQAQSALLFAEEEAHTYAFPYAVAFLSTLLIMTILCSPTRKR
jgi:hypothetical protein